MKIPSLTILNWDHLSLSHVAFKEFYRTQLGIIAHPSTKGPEARGPGHSEQSWLHREVQASLGYMDPETKTTTKQTATSLRGGGHFNKSQ